MRLIGFMSVYLFFFFSAHVLLPSQKESTLDTGQSVMLWKPLYFVFTLQTLVKDAEELSRRQCWKCLSFSYHIVFSFFLFFFLIPIFFIFLFLVLYLVHGLPLVFFFLPTQHNFIELNVNAGIVWVKRCAIVFIVCVFMTCWFNNGDAQTVETVNFDDCSRWGRERSVCGN